MSEKFKTTDLAKLYFVTFTITNWQDVLLDDSIKMIIVNALKYYQENRGLILVAYSIMPSHVHLIAKSNENEQLSAILRDVKKFSAKAIIAKLENENNEESNKRLQIFINEGERLKRIKKYKVWKDGIRPIMIYSQCFLRQKMDYIHDNAPKAGLVELPENYQFSSARNYSGFTGVLEIVMVSDGVR